MTEPYEQNSPENGVDKEKVRAAVLEAVSELIDTNELLDEGDKASAKLSGFFYGLMLGILPSSIYGRMATEMLGFRGPEAIGVFIATVVLSEVIIGAFFSKGVSDIQQETVEKIGDNLQQRVLEILESE